MEPILLEFNFAVFLGRLHPLVVHLPIGFLLLAGLFFYLGKKGKYAFLKNTLPLILLLSAISSLAAALFGWLLAGSGGYDAGTLFWHRWLGISVTILSVVAWRWTVGAPSPRPSSKVYSRRWNRLWRIGTQINGGKKLPAWLMGMVVVLLFVTGHLGGNLTHGQGYLLTYAPGFLQQFFGAGENNIGAVQDFPENPDSIRIYADLIQPVFEQKCINCHNEGKKKGGLILESPEGLLSGGDGGEVLAKGAPMESELLRRLMLDPNSEKFMPQKGMPMTYQEIRILEYWIASGVSFDTRITNEDIPDDIKALIEGHYGLSTQKKTYVETVQVVPAPGAQITALQEEGFRVRPLAQDNNLLEITFKDELNREKLSTILGIKEQLTWLNLGKTGFQDDWMAVLGQLPNLTRLRLDRNPITDAGLVHLNGLAHLESLNIYGTAITDEGLPALENLAALQKLFLWQTKVSPEGAKALQSKRPGLEIDLGFGFVQKNGE